MEIIIIAAVAIIILDYLLLVPGRRDERDDIGQELFVKKWRNRRMNCMECVAGIEDHQTGDFYCQELGAIISPGAVNCPRKDEKKCKDQEVGHE